jgi:hypothetical protein
MPVEGCRGSTGGLFALGGKRRAAQAWQFAALSAESAWRHTHLAALGGKCRAAQSRQFAACFERKVLGGIHILLL